MTDAKTDKSQSNKFKEAARALGADESDDALDKAMGRLELQRKTPMEPSSSDEDNPSAETP